MQITCPNCGEDIELIGSVAIKSEFGLGPNAIDARRKAGGFPEPVLDLTNRLLWLRRDVEEAMAKETEDKILDFVQELERSLATLPEGERQKAREMFTREMGSPRRAEREKEVRAKEG
jgi:hypothetical protein